MIVSGCLASTDYGNITPRALTQVVQVVQVVRAQQNVLPLLLSTNHRSLPSQTDTPS